LLDRKTYDILIKAIVQGGSLPILKRREVELMNYVTWQDLLLLATVIIALLAYIDKRKK